MNYLAARLSDAAEGSCEALSPSKPFIRRLLLLVSLAPNLCDTCDTCGLRMTPAVVILTRSDRQAR
jgi:hypothetical protein